MKILKTLSEKIKILSNAYKVFIDGDCTEEKIDNTAYQLGYINPANYLNVDKTCKYLGVTSDEFYKKIKPKYDLDQEKVNNAPIGYYIHDLNKIKEDMQN